MVAAALLATLGAPGVCRADMTGDAPALLTFEALAIPMIAHAFRDESVGRQYASLGGALGGAMLAMLVEGNLRFDGPQPSRLYLLGTVLGAIAGGTAAWFLAAWPDTSRTLVAGAGCSVGLAIALGVEWR